MSNETCNCHACTQIRWRATLQGQIEPMILLPERTPIFTDYEIRVLKELAKQTDRHFMPDADKAAEV